MTRGLQLPKVRGAKNGFNSKILTQDDIVNKGGTPY